MAPSLTFKILLAGLSNRRYVNKPNYLQGLSNQTGCKHVRYASLVHIIIYTKRFVSTFLKFLKFLCSIGKITVLVYWKRS